MKKLIAICWFMANVFVVNAQSPTFDETLRYCNRMLNEYHYEYQVDSITVEKTGKLVVFQGHRIHTSSIKNLFDFKSYTTNEKSHKYGFDLSLFEDDQKENKLGEFYFTTASSRDKFTKALLYLRTLCIKPKELFEL